MPGRSRRSNRSMMAFELSTNAVAILGFVALFALMLLRVPVGMAMGLVGVTGFGFLTGGMPALKMVGQTSMRTVADYGFGVIPMFLLMGAIVSASGMSRELFRVANTFAGHLRGGLGIATIIACAGFAAISGSSVATAATFSTVAYPEMRQFRYPQSFSTGVIAAGGTLGAMFPPSTVLAIYGLITQQDIGKLFIAGILPGLLAVSMYIVTVAIIGWVRPGAPPGRSGSPRCAASGRRSCCSVSSSADFMAGSSRRPRRAASAPAARSCSPSPAAGSAARNCCNRCCMPHAPRRRSSPC
jgi:C4-dicarboxylate transporter, DctM subunit